MVETIGYPIILRYLDVIANHSGFSRMRHAIGILALQGNFHQHAEVVAKLGLNPVKVRSSQELFSTQGLILPGGESTTQSRLLDANGLRDAIRAFARTRPILGTCAGLILMAKKLGKEQATSGVEVRPLGLLDVLVRRNAYGRQVHSKTDNIVLCQNGSTESSTHISTEAGTFIRAPAIESMDEGVEVLATYLGKACAVRQGTHVGLSFHPEVSGITYFHELCFKNLLS